MPDPVAHARPGGVHLPACLPPLNVSRESSLAAAALVLVSSGVLRENVVRPLENAAEIKRISVNHPKPYLIYFPSESDLYILHGKILRCFKNLPFLWDYLF